VGGEREAGLFWEPTRAETINRNSGNRQRNKADAEPSHCSYSAAAGIDYSRDDGWPAALRTMGASRHHHRNAGFIRQPQCHSPACRMNPAFPLAWVPALVVVPRAPGNNSGAKPDLRPVIITRYLLTLWVAWS
jgi:hypothetical protein